MTSPLNITGIGDVFSRYDGFVLDLWGVVHDGINPMPGTIHALQELKAARKKVWLLSNAPRRAYTVIEKLTEMGVVPELYTGILTSGEVTWQALKDGLAAKWGRRCYHIGGGRDMSLFEDVDIERVTDPAKADFVLNSGVADFSEGLDHYMPVLKKCAAAKLPMICANPDRIVHVQGQLVICAGMLADEYIKLEGDVTWFGKPYRGVYTRILKDMGVPRVIAVGDSMVTDIAGATGAGIDSVLVTSGIHREEFPDISPDAAQVSRFLTQYPYRPTYLLREFGW